MISGSKTMASFLFAFNHILNHFFREFFPFSMSIEFLFNVVFIKIRFIENTFDNQFLKIFRETEEFFLIKSIYYCLRRRTYD